MTGMLASVTSIAEAKVVLNAGADIIDIKNPHEGALGAQEINVVKDIVKYANRAVLTSATVGDMDSNDPELLNRIIKMSETGVDYVKVGLFETKPSSDFIRSIINAVNKGIKIVIVLFAENYQGVDSVRLIMQMGITGIMLDTKEKKGENLCSILNSNELIQFVELAKENNLITGLAGSLRSEDIAGLLELNPDYLGFRGALCSQSNRINEINKEQVDKIRKAIPYTNLDNFEKRALHG